MIYYEITPADLSVGLEETVDVDWIFIEDPVNDVAFINELIPRLLMARLEEENEADPVLLDCG